VMDLPEETNLLSGTLSPAGMAAYDSLTNKLETYFMHSTYMDGDGTFNDRDRLV
jgi:hypothetical protein